jgi:HAD superfamily hydrolase (TIGR01509 family)
VVRAFDGVLFDFGHTLFTNRSAQECAAEFRKASAQDVDPDAYASVWAEIRQLSRQPAELAKGRDLSPALHRKCWMELLAPLDQLATGLAQFTYELDSSPEGWEPYPDAVPVLTELRRRDIRIGIVSDCGWDIRDVFKVHGLDELVDSYDLSFEHGVCKPAAQMFASACTQLSVEPNRALMVGDTPSADCGAAALGIVTLILPARDRASAPALSHVLDLVG